MKHIDYWPINAQILSIYDRISKSISVIAIYLFKNRA